MPRKRAAKKSPAKPGKGHNKPPPDHVPPPAPANIASGYTGKEAAVWASVVHDTAARHRSFRAALGIGTPTTDTPHAQAHNSTYLHRVMLRSIAALEQTIRKLPTPLDEEVEEVKRELAKLKALPPVPTRLPTDAVQAQAKLRKFGEQVLSSLATQVVSAGLKEAAKELWASYGHQLIATAQSIGEWIANLPL